MNYCEGRILIGCLMSQNTSMTINPPTNESTKTAAKTSSTSKNPQREVIASAIRRDYIDVGHVQPGTAIPRIRDLARIYSVSPGTIQNAIGILQAQGVIYSLAGSGCYVSPPAPDRRDPATAVSVSKLIGLVCQVRNELTMRLQVGVDSRCREESSSMVTALSEHRYEDELAQVQRAINSGCNGVIIEPSVRVRGRVENDYLLTQALPVPLVLVDMALPGQPHSQVLFDNYRAGYEMTRYLIKKGHRQIVFMEQEWHGTLQLQLSVQDRHRGYLRALHNDGLAVPPGEALRSDEEGGRYDFGRWLKQWKAHDPRSTAVIAIEDTHAAALISQAALHGIEVPRDLEIVGFDDLSVRHTVSPSFPSVRADWELAGSIAVDLLMQHLRGDLKPPVVYMLPTTLVIPT